ncbi:MAG TPA: hypothetical protein VLO00_08775 [Cryobacterium sp.]|nr:hypothetical protein [Cryobacterium sp.]
MSGPDQAVRRRRQAGGPVFWGGLAVLIGGLLMAGLAVSAIAASLQRGRDLEHYAEASISAARTESLGADAVATGRRLAELSRSDAVDAVKMQQLLVQGDDVVFNALKAESNARIDAEADAHNRMVELANQLNRME